jgi:uncharacterized membrane protein YbhN (UPF0104 family)
VTLPTRTARSIQVLLGLAVSAGCLLLAFVNAPTAELGEALAHANYWWLLPAAALQVVAVIARARRWQLLLPNRAGLSELFWAQGIGFLATNLLPLRAGEAARVLVASQRARLPVVRVGASAVLERVLDVLTILAVLALLLPFMAIPPAALAAAGVLGIGLILALLVVATLVALDERGEALVRLVADRLPSSLGRVAITHWRDLADGLRPVRRPGDAVGVLFWSAVTWVIAIVSFWLVIEAVTPGGSWREASFAVVALSIGVSVPSSPGFVGVYQLIGQQALAAPFPDRYSSGAALTIAILGHLVYYVTTTALGVVGLARLGLSLATVRAEASQLTTGPEARLPDNLPAR